MIKDSERAPRGKFHIMQFPGIKSGNPDNKFIVVLYGKFSLVYCGNNALPLKEAKARFWRLIGAA